MFNQISRIDDAAIKINQVKILMGLLIKHHDTIPKKDQETIIHLAYDLLSDEEKALIGVSATLVRTSASR